MKRMVLMVMMVAAIFALVPKAVLAGTGDETERLEKLKALMLEQGDMLLNQSKKMANSAGEYYEIIKHEKFNYQEAFSKNRQKIVLLLKGMKESWMQMHNTYEGIEGIVAGIPSLSKYDLILDAGIPASEGKEDVSPYNLKLPDSRVLKEPGNLFHNLLEPSLWGTVKKYIGAAADLDGNGKTELGEALPEANVLYASAKAFTVMTEKMLEDMKAWKPNRTDVFTALTTMVPTVGEYFEEWKASGFVTGKIPMFVAQSRLIDIKGILNSTRTMYLEGASKTVAQADSALDERIKNGFLDLLSYVDGVYKKEMSGHLFKPEEADRLGSEAQDKADKLTALITKAAKKLKVEFK